MPLLARLQSSLNAERCSTLALLSCCRLCCLNLAAQTLTVLPGALCLPLSRLLPTCCRDPIAGFILNTGDFSATMQAQDKHVPRDQHAAVRDEVLDRFSEGYEPRLDVVDGQQVSRTRSVALQGAWDSNDMLGSSQHAVCCLFVCSCGFASAEANNRNTCIAFCLLLQVWSFVTPSGKLIRSPDGKPRLVKNKAPFFLADEWNRWVLDMRLTLAIKHTSRRTSNAACALPL